MKNKIYIWIILSVITFVGAMVSLVNLLASANLGYDATTQGKTIINMWYYAFCGLMICAFVSTGILIISILLKKRRKATANNRLEMDAAKTRRAPQP
jgi:hypothetical protein